MRKNAIAFFILGVTMAPQIIFDFNTDANIQNWRVVDDGVMGGKSLGNFRLDASGHGVFEGEISLENNGGFSSVRYGFEKMAVQGHTKVQRRWQNLSISNQREPTGLLFLHHALSNIRRLAGNRNSSRGYVPFFPRKKVEPTEFFRSAS